MGLNDQSNANVVVSAQNQQYNQAMQQSAQHTNILVTSLDALTARLDGITKRSGKKLMFFAASDFAALSAATAVAASFEKQMSAAAASASLTGRNISSLKNEVNALSRSLPVSRGEVAALVTQLTQITGMTSKGIGSSGRTMINLSSATGSDLGVITDQMISLSKATGTLSLGAQGLSKYSDVVTTLSARAHVAATSMLGFASSITPVARAAGATEKQILGISAAFSSVGQDGTQAANAFNTILTDITNLTRTGSPELAKYSNIVGMTVQQFKGLSATAQASTVFDAIGRSGARQLPILQQLGFDSPRVARVFSAVAQQGGVGKYVNMAEGAYGNGSTASAAHVAEQGLFSNMTMIRNNLQEMAIAIGSGILPVARALTGAFNVALQSVNAFAKPLLAVAGVLAGVVGSIAGPIGGVMSMMSSAFPFAAGAMLLRSKPVASFRRNMQVGRMGDDAINDMLNTNDPKDYGIRYLNNEGGRLERMFGGAGLGLGANLGPGGSESYKQKFMRWGTKGVNFGAGMLDSTQEWWKNAGLAGLNRSNTWDDRIAHGEQRASEYQAAYNGMRMNGKGVGESLAAANEAWSRAIKSTAKEADSLGGAFRRLASSGIGVVTEAGKTMAKGGFSAAGSVGRGVFGGIGSAFGGGAVLGGAVSALALGTMLYQYNKGQNAAADARQSSMDLYSGLSGIPNGVSSAVVPNVKVSAKSLSSDAGAMGFKTSYNTHEMNVAGSSAYKLNDKTLATLDIAQAKKYVASMAPGMAPQTLEYLKLDLYKRFGQNADEVISEIPAYNQKIAGRLSSFSPTSVLHGAGAGLSVGLRGAFGMSSSNDLAAASKSMFQSAQVSGGMAMNQTGDLGYTRNVEANQIFKAVVGGMAGNKTNSSVSFQGLTQILKGFEQYGITGLKTSGFGYGGFWGAGHDNATHDFQNAKNDAERAKVLGRVLSTSQSGKDFMDMYGGRKGFEKAAMTTPMFPGDAINSANAALQRSPVGSYAVRSSLIQKSAYGDLQGNPYGAVNDLAAHARTLSGGFAQGEESLRKMMSAIGTTTDNMYQLASAARDQIRAQREFLAPSLSRRQNVTDALNQYKTISNSPDRAYAGYNDDVNTAKAKAQQAIGSQTEFLRSFNQAYYQYNKQRVRSIDGFNREERHSIEDYNIQVAHSNRDFQRQELWSLQDFQKQKKYSIQDYNTQVGKMVIDSARTIYNPYQRVQAQGTASSTIVLYNMNQQLGLIRRQRANIKKLLAAGITQQTIDVMGWADPSNAQQVEKLTQDILSDRSQVSQFNSAVDQRVKATKSLVADKVNEDFRYSEKAFNLSLQRSQKAFDTATSHSEKQFATSMKDSRDAFARSMKWNRSSLAIQLGYSKDDFLEFGKEFTGGYNTQFDNAQKALITLTQGNRSVLLNEIRKTNSAIKPLLATQAGIIASPNSATGTGGTNYSINGVGTVNVSGSGADAKWKAGDPAGAPGSADYQNNSIAMNKSIERRKKVMNYLSSSHDKKTSTMIINALKFAGIKNIKDSALLDIAKQRNGSGLPGDLVAWVEGGVNQVGIMIGNGLFATADPQNGGEAVQGVSGLKNIMQGKVPGLWKGGVVTRKTYSALGEHGPEVVLPLNDIGAKYMAGMMRQVSREMLSTFNMAGKQTMFQGGMASAPVQHMQVDKGNHYYGSIVVQAHDVRQMQRDLEMANRRQNLVRTTRPRGGR